MWESHHDPAVFADPFAFQPDRFVHADPSNDQLPTWQWLNYRVVHLYGRHPGYISTRLLPKNRWPAYWYTSLRLAKSYVARSYDGRVAAVFLEESERSASWTSLLGSEPAILILGTTDHTSLFDQPTVNRWVEFLRPMLR